MRKNLLIWEMEQGYKAKYVADRLGISHSTWSNIKSGRSNPTYELLGKFQREFEPKENIITLFAED